MKDKQASRLRRAKRTRAKISELRTHRLCVHRTPRHIYAQIIDPTGGAKGAGVTEVSFDRSGFKYHGRVKALAEAAREAGLAF